MFVALLMSSTAITLKFKMGWLPNKVSNLAEKLKTDINLAPLMPYEDKIEHDDVTCKPRIAPAYSQGNELVFGQNAGQQLIVAMSLCSLI